MKENAFNDLVPTRGRAAKVRHRREVFWQVTIPFILGLAVLLGAAGLTAGSAWTGSAPGVYRDVALIWVLLLTMVSALIPFAVLIGLAYGVIRLIVLLPGWMYKIQRFVLKVEEAASRISRAVTAPMIRVNAFSSGLRQLFKPSGPQRRLPE